jgi:hypothetical protein
MASGWSLNDAVGAIYDRGVYFGLGVTAALTEKKLYEIAMSQPAGKFRGRPSPKTCAFADTIHFRCMHPVDFVFVANIGDD